MLKNILLTFILATLFGIPVIFYSCCADEQCSEEDTFGKTVLHKTDTLIEKVPKQSRGPMSVQIGAFANENYANKFANSAREKLSVSVNVKLSREGIYRVVIGEYENIADARETLNLVKNKGYYDSFIRDEYGEIER